MSISRKRVLSMTTAGIALLALSACDENGQFLLAQNQNADQTGTAQVPANRRTVERDVEAPDVFSATEAGLWDGRPSLGGVWVAHPDVKEPERVIIRNPSNGKFVVGALFRRERDIPGPRIQISSDAANSLGMLAGAPAELNVTALRREEIEEDGPDAAAAPEETDTVEAPEAVSETPLDPVASAGAAIDAAPDPAPDPAPNTNQNPASAASTAATTAASTAATTASTTAAAAPAAAAKPPSRPQSALDKPFLQVGIFSVEANANRTATVMRNAGMIPTIRRFETNGKPFWRVIVGPAGTSGERASLLEKIRAEGFTDAYAVTN